MNTIKNIIIIFILFIINALFIFLIITDKTDEEFEILCKNNWYEYFKSVIFSKVDKPIENYILVYDKDKSNCLIFWLWWKVIDEVHPSYIREWNNNIENKQKREKERVNQLFKIEFLKE